MAETFFCLDFSESFIKIADISKNNNQLEAAALAYGEINSNFLASDSEKIIEEQAGHLTKLVNSLKITKKNAAIVIPDAASYSQIMEMPRLNEKELISAIKYQSDQFIPMPVEEANIDLEIVSEDVTNKKITVLMVAAPKKFIEKIQRTVEAAGLIPTSIENELNAAARFITDFYKLLDKNIADCAIIINLGFNSTSIYFFNPKSSLILQNHTFNIGYNLFLKEIQVNANVDPQKASEILKVFDLTGKSSYPVETIVAPIVKEFIFEIKRFVNLIADKYQSSIKKIYLINEVFRFPAMAKMIEQSSSVETHQFDPYPLFKQSPLIESHKTDLSLFISTIGGNLR